MARLECRNEVVENPIDDVLVKHAVVSERLEIELQALELHAQFIGDVLDVDLTEVRLTRLGTKRRKLRSCMVYYIVPLRMRIGERFQYRFLVSNVSHFSCLIKKFIIIHMKTANHG